MGELPSGGRLRRLGAGGVRRRRPRVADAADLRWVEENLVGNRMVRDALAAQGYPVTLVETRDAHNWTSWRDTFEPHLLRFLQATWG